MCGRYVRKQNLAEICAAFGIGTLLSELNPAYNIGPGRDCAVIVKDRLGMISWSWPTQDDTKPLINIRSETACDKPTFKDAWQKGRRCLIPASGFYEWDSSGQPFYVEDKNAPHIAFCALWTRDWQAKPCFAILTCAALSKLAPIHPRMPLTATPDSAHAWLENAHLPPAPAFYATPISRAVNTISNDNPDLLDPLQAAPQGNLFMAG